MHRLLLVGLLVGPIILLLTVYLAYQQAVGERAHGLQDLSPHHKIAGDIIRIPVVRDNKVDGHLVARAVLVGNDLILNEASFPIELTIADERLDGLAFSDTYDLKDPYFKTDRFTSEILDALNSRSEDRIYFTAAIESVAYRSNHQGVPREPLEARPSSKLFP